MKTMIVRVLFLCCLFTTPALALVLISESRNVFVDYHGGGDRSELITSAGTFGLFDATPLGIPFGGGAVYVRQTSNITTAGFDLFHSVQDYYGPGGVGESNFSFTFQLNQPTPILITGYSFYFSGYATLNGTALTWAGPTGVRDIYNNYLNFNQVLGAGTYTFTSKEWLRGDGISTRIALRDQSVPDGGSSAWMLAVGLLSLAAIRRKLSALSIRRWRA
jgi:hypothetical protein